MSETFCQSCDYWDKPEWPRDRGQCRRRVPVVSSDPDRRGVWPRTHVLDWCGEHSDLASARGEPTPSTRRAISMGPVKA